MELQDRTLDDIMLLNLNLNTLDEVNNKNVTYKMALEAVEEHIKSLKFPNGRKVRKNGIESMIQVYRSLFEFMDKTNGQCYPSMETIAMDIEPSLKVNPTYKAITAVKVRVWRAIHALIDFGIIKAHIYRAETNRRKKGEKVDRYPNFFYELMPISVISAKFAAAIIAVTGVAVNIAVAIANAIDHYMQTEIEIREIFRQSYTPVKRGRVKELESLII